MRSDPDAAPGCLRVLSVVSIASATGAYGGPFDIAIQQARLLDEDGVVIRVFAGAFRGDEPDRSPQLRIFRARRVLPRVGFAGVMSWPLVPALWVAIKRADVAHIALAREPIPLISILIARLRGTPVIAQPHGMLTSRTTPWHRAFDFFVTRPLIGARTSLVALTDVEARELAHWRGDSAANVGVLGNPVPAGVRPEVRSRKGAVAADVAFIARLHPRKRVAVFSSAAAEAENAGWTEQYSVLGPDEGDLPELLRAVARLDNLHYEGATDADGVVDRLRRADLFVLTAHSEPWGNVLATALTLGRPVVVTASAALAGLVGQYRAGIVVADDDAGGVAVAVHSILTEGSYGEYAANSVRLAQEKFGTAAFLHRLRATYANAIWANSKTTLEVRAPR